MMKMSMIYEALLTYHADLVIDQALAKYKKERLLEEIDLSLLAGDRKRFLALTSELKLLEFGEEKED